MKYFPSTDEKILIFGVDEKLAFISRIVNWIIETFETSHQINRGEFQ
jgi:hypothetical protein